MVHWGDLHNESPSGTRNRKDMPGVKSRLDSGVAEEDWSPVHQLARYREIIVVLWVQIYSAVNSNCCRH